MLTKMVALQWLLQRASDYSLGLVILSFSFGLILAASLGLNDHLSRAATTPGFDRC